MIKVALYTGAGVSLSPLCPDGAKLSSFVRLVADEGMGLTRDNEHYFLCVDTNCPEEWQEHEAPELWDDDAEEADYLSALDRLGVTE